MTANVQNVKVPVFPWWLVLLRGIVSVVLGLLLLVAPGATLLVLIQFMGLFWLIGGLLDIVSIFIDRSAWGWKLFAGILGIVAGILVLQHPLWSTVLLPTIAAFILGVQGIIIGILELIMAFQDKSWGIAILGVLSILFGLVLFFNPLLSAIILVYVVAIFSLIGGILAIVLAFRLR